MESFFYFTLKVKTKVHRVTRLSLSVFSKGISFDREETIEWKDKFKPDQAGFLFHCFLWSSLAIISRFGINLELLLGGGGRIFPVCSCLSFPKGSLQQSVVKAFVSRCPWQLLIYFEFWDCKSPLFSISSYILVLSIQSHSRVLVRRYLSSVVDQPKLASRAVRCRLRPK